jgi:hypothetical protein
MPVRVRTSTQADQHSAWRTARVALRRRQPSQVPGPCRSGDRCAPHDATPPVQAPCRASRRGPRLRRHFVPTTFAAPHDVRGARAVRNDQPSITPQRGSSARVDRSGNSTKDLRLRSRRSRVPSSSRSAPSGRADYAHASRGSTWRGPAASRHRPPLRVPAPNGCNRALTNRTWPKCGPRNKRGSPRHAPGLETPPERGFSRGPLLPLRSLWGTELPRSERSLLCRSTTAASIDRRRSNATSFVPAVIDG